ncbi:unnamed protein product [Chironomus riparius]|uniref:Uncharacterized protein n=1 Tax=Chironomus riparius TaxID=315576 RepID=A0A9N9S7J1_9DIPT|nr:unnamed protein product [Chironomus riparius]
MAKSEQKYCTSTSNMIILIGIILSILGIAATVTDFYYYLYFARNRLPISTGHLFFIFTAIVMYFLAAIYSSCLLCLDGLRASKVFDSYNFFTIVSVICALFDGFMKISLNPIVSLMFFVYCGLGALSLVVTWTAENELKKEKQAILNQFNTGQLVSQSGNSPEHQMLSSIGQDEMPKFSMNLEAVKVED